MSAAADPGWALAAFVAVVLGTERLVAFARAAVPAWLDDERRNAAGEVDLSAGRGGRLRLQALAYAAALALAGPAAETGRWGAGEARLPLPLVALAASGGAAFWSQCLRRVAAGRALSVTRGAVETLRLRRRAEARGATPLASGRAARPLARTADRRGRLLLQLYAHAPEHLLAPTETAP